MLTLSAIEMTPGLTLDGDGLRRGRKLLAAESEEDIYAALGLPFIEPELREGRGEIERAIKGKLPSLVTDRDLCGILHAHTDLSDGVDTLEVMAEATRNGGISTSASPTIPNPRTMRAACRSTKSCSSTAPSTG